MNCPSCNIALQIAERRGIEIDYCSKCRGVWLDRGELDKLLESAANPSAHRPGEHSSGDRREYREDDYREKKHYKKKSLLSEIFDF